MMEHKIELGRLVATRGVAELMETEQDFSNFISDSLKRYTRGDWGELCDDDCTMNDDAIKKGERVLASYDNPKNKNWKIWIITEWDRSVTTILFPREY